MSNEKTGGAAFPIHEENVQGVIELTDSGMTLLDYFAARAMPEIMASMVKRESIYMANDGTVAAEATIVCARYAYETAAAMIEERKKYMQP